MALHHDRHQDLQQYARPQQAVMIMPECPNCHSVNVDYEDTPPSRHSVGIIIYHCRDCGLTEKEETGKEYVLGDKIAQASFKQQIDTHYRLDDALRKRWNNLREEKRE